jgi:hypothetical protein
MKQLLFFWGCLAAGFLPVEAGNELSLVHNITSVSVKDARDRVWDGGCYTQDPIVNFGYESGSDSNVHSLRVAIVKSNGMVRVARSFTLLEFAVNDNSPDIDITEIVSGETARFDVSVPGRYCLAYCAVDEENQPLFSGSIQFDSLYDDGNWIVCGDAELSSGVLSSENRMSHLFSSNGTGFMESPGDDIWCECPLTYPYYSGEKWNAKIEYHPVLKKYRIVNPFSCNPEFKDFLPDDDELLSEYYHNVSYSPEGFIFDRDNPSWFLLNAEFETFTYCEPMRTGIAVCHADSPHRYTANLYNEMIGFVRYDVCPEQNIKRTGRYVDMPMADERRASLIVDFPAWTTGVSEVCIDGVGEKVYYTIDGRRTDRPGKGLYLVRQGSSVSKCIK